MNKQKPSQERLIAYISVLKKHKLKAFANKFSETHNVDYSKYTQATVDILIRGSLKTHFIIFNFLQKYLKSLPPKQILILLNLAVYEYFFMNTESFAILNEWVEICPRQFKKLVNAILRNITREFPNRKLELNTSQLLPVFIQDSLDKALKDKKIMFFNDFLKTPSIFMLAKNKDEIKKTSFREKFDIQTVTIDTNEYLYTKNAKILKKLKKEFIYIQDLAPQIILNKTFEIIGKQRLSLHNVKDEFIVDRQYKASKQKTKTLSTNSVNNFSVLDMCSAPGGKTINIALTQVKTQESIKNIKLCLTEKNPYRIKDLEDNLNRLNIKTHKIKTIDAGSKNYPKIIKEESHENNGFDLIVLDAPCSSIGTIKRHPEIMLRVNEDTCLLYQTEQLKLLQNAFRSVKKGGHILYTVCSFSELETVEVVEIFKANFDLRLLESGYVYESFDEVSSDLHFYAIFVRN